jgi:hypothetical protein
MCLASTWLKKNSEYMQGEAQQARLKLACVNAAAVTYRYSLLAFYVAPHWRQEYCHLKNEKVVKMF